VITCRRGQRERPPSIRKGECDSQSQQSEGVEIYPPRTMSEATAECCQRPISAESNGCTTKMTRATGSRLIYLRLHVIYYIVYSTYYVT
jgi:hypothetical protein